MQAAISTTTRIADGQRAEPGALFGLWGHLACPDQRLLDTRSGAERDPAQQVMGDGYQEKHTQDPVRASYQQLRQAMSSTLGIDAFGGGPTLLVDLFGLICLHAFSPLRHFRRIVRPLVGVLGDWVGAYTVTPRRSSAVMSSRVAKLPAIRYPSGRRPVRRIICSRTGSA
jgi:hypothetical protein